MIWLPHHAYERSSEFFSSPGYLFVWNVSASYDLVNGMVVDLITADFLQSECVQASVDVAFELELIV